MIDTEELVRRGVEVYNTERRFTDPMSEDIDKRNSMAMFAFFRSIAEMIKTAIESHQP